MLSAPETPEEKKHNVQLMFGNGLRPQVSSVFVNLIAHLKAGIVCRFGTTLQAGLISSESESFMGPLRAIPALVC